MKRLIGFLFLWNIICYSQAPNIEWQKTFGGSLEDYSHTMIQTSDGGYIFCGYTTSNDGDVTGNHGNEDGWIVKTNYQGTIEWQKTYGGSSTEVFENIIQVSDGYVLAGYSGSVNGDLTSNKGQHDFWIVKINTVGTIVWQKVYGGTSYESANYIVKTSDGGYMITGTTSSINIDVTSNYGTSDMWVIKLNSIGDLQWQKTFGGTQDDKGHCVKETLDGGFIIAGMTNSINGNSTGNHGGYDAFVVKIDSLGNTQWIKILGGANMDAANSIVQISGGDYVFSGYTLSNNGDVSGNHGGFDAWVVRLNSEGTIVWQKTIGGLSLDQSSYIDKTNDGGLIISTITFSNDGDVSGNHGSYDYFITKLNLAGTIMWTKTLGGTGYDWVHKVNAASDGGYIVCGYSESSNGDLTGNHGTRDAWVVKLASDNLGRNEFNEDFQVSFFPNPTKEFINVNMGTLTETVYQFTLIDINGKVVLENTINNPKQIENVNIGNLVQGVYLAILNAGDKKITRKVVIE